MVALHLTQEEEQSSVMVVDRDESEEDKLYNILWLNKIEKYCKTSSALGAMVQLTSL